MMSGKALSELYCHVNGLVVDIGGRNVNGSLRSFFEKKGMRYICIDMDPDLSVDIFVLPGDKLPFEDWRFYSDAGQALAYWSGKQLSNEIVYPVQVVETFNILDNFWNDFVCVWKRVDIENSEKNIHVKNEILNSIGILEQRLMDYGLTTRKRC